MARQWAGDGPKYEIAWGGTDWTLRLDDPHPGLFSSRSGPLLALEGVAERGRWAPEALSGSSLVAHECRFGRVEATYKPEAWGEMTVRAAWFPVGEDGLGLEVELSARSVEELHDVEVKVLSALEPVPPKGAHRSVEPRDPHSAALTYDGREPDLETLVTGPPGDPLGPWMVARTGREGWAYVEMVYPHDASRRIHEGKLPFSATRYGLFGYDLERGVVLRARLRGHWLLKDEAFTEAGHRFRAFLDEPPPLRT